jgi:sarcosine oxidase
MSEQVEHLVVGLGALGSATAWQLARRGHDVVGLERFELGHERGASHDTSRILRHSYHTPAYVELTRDAYADWADLEAATGRQLVTTVGGLDLFPEGAAIPAVDYVRSLTACGIDFEQLSADDVRRRWPVLEPGDGTSALYQADGAIVPAARGTAAMQDAARAAGARLRDGCRVTGLRDLGAEGVEVTTSDVTYRARRVVVCADAWTAELLAGLGHDLPLTVTLEQVTYFAPAAPARFEPGRLPLWIWMDDPSWYGFPCYGEPTVKAAQDCGGPVVSGDGRGFDPDPARVRRLADFMQGLLPGVGEPVRSKTCLYTLTPDRDFVLSPVPGHEAVVVGLGAAHGFKFAPTLGRLLAELAATGTSSTDLYPYRLDRPALTEADHAVSWLV